MNSPHGNDSNSNSGMTSNNQQSATIDPSIIDISSQKVLRDKPEDKWTCGIDRRTGKPGCTEYPDYYSLMDADEVAAMKVWEDNTSDYIKKLQQSNELEAQKAWQNVQKLIPDIRAKRQSRYDSSKSVVATNLNDAVRYYDQSV